MKKNNFFYSKYSQIVISSISLAIVFLFAGWWFRPDHVPDNFSGAYRFFDLLLFALVSYVIWHPIVMDVLIWAISFHIKDIRQQKPVPGLKVAFITTIVPQKEPVELLHKCLPAMVNVKYKHDTWLLDEGDNNEVKRICKKYGVKHFSRCGKSEYNTIIGKYTRTKGGNHNSWYDAYGDKYDIVAQIDTDFVPKRNFLIKTLGYFRDPKISFVGTPQVYANTNKSFVARGASEQQFNFYGAVLRGLSGLGMTLLIGANHIIRVAAFKKVDHYTAHITEDLITGIKLHANGWKSIYVPYPLAKGEGPTTWESYFSQQLRWAYGCMDILFRHSPGQLRKMGLRQALYYFFLQQHYFSGLAMALSILLLSLYFVFGLRTADVDTVRFFTSYSLVLLICWLMSVWLQRYDVNRKKEGELQLAGKVISIAAWPVWFLGFINAITGRRLKYKVTPKGESDAVEKTSLSVFSPHFIFASIAIAGLISSVFTHRNSMVMLLWAASSAILMLAVPFVNQIVSGLYKLRSVLYAYIQKHYLVPRTVREKAGNIKLLHPLVAVNRQGYDLIREKIMDCVFLSIVVVISFLPYIHKIGFYSDDWSFLGNFKLSADQSLMGLFLTATTPNTQMRPMQNLYDAALYIMFGTQPLGYQIVNALVFLFIILLFYIIMRQLNTPRILAITAPLVYALLPHYSTDRFWYAAFQVNLSMLFFLFSTSAGLKALSLKTDSSLYRPETI